MRRVPALICLILFMSTSLAYAGGPIPAEKLATYLPAMLGDMPRYRNPSLSGMGTDWTVASVKFGKYGRGGVVRIFHYATERLSAIPPILAMRKVARDNEQMVIRADQIGGYDVLLTWDRAHKRSTAKVVIDTHILVVVEIIDTPAFDAALDAVKGINLAGLSALLQ